MRLPGSIQTILNETVAWMRQVGTRVVFIAGVFVLVAIGIALLLVFGVVALWIVVIYVAIALALVVWRRIRNRFGWRGRSGSSDAPATSSPGQRFGQRHDVDSVKTIDVVAEVTYVDETGTFGKK